MIRTVEKGKTLLVDGPASVLVTSGKVEAFGATVDHTRRVLIREGKRLPFIVEEKASFDISLGENATVEEAEGDTTPPTWIESAEELLKIQTKPLTVMVVGAIDSGKTSLCTYITNKALQNTHKVAVLDGDLGQSDVGPPCTVAYCFVSKPVTDLFNLTPKNAVFVGATSPSVAPAKVVEGLCVLVKEILAGHPDLVIVDTDGWIDGEEAVAHKVKLVEELEPDIILCLQTKDELAPFLSAVEGVKKTIVESPSAIKQRTKERRKNLRELGYMKYLKNAKVQSLPLSWVRFEENGFGLGGSVGSRQAGKLYELLGMKPLHIAEMKDRIDVIIGRTRWIGEENIRKVEEFTQKRVKIIRKGEEEGLLIALHNADKKFLGIGILKEIDYLRKTIKILTAVSGEISMIALGKVKLDKNLKEVAMAPEEGHSSPSALTKLF